MPEQEEKVIELLKKVAQEHPYQTLVVQFEVHESKLASGKILKQEKKLG